MDITIKTRNLKPLGGLASGSVGKKLPKLHEELFALECAEGMGFVKYPDVVEKAEFARIKKASKDILEHSKVLLVIGTEDILCSIKGALSVAKRDLKITIMTLADFDSAEKIDATIKYLSGKDYSVFVASKYTENVGISYLFALFENLLKKKYKKNNDYKKHIFIATDYSTGELREIASSEGYENFVFPRTLTERFGGLSPAILFPAMVAGLNIEKIIAGAKKMETELASTPIAENLAYNLAKMLYVYCGGRAKEQLVAVNTKRLNALQNVYINMFDGVLAEAKKAPESKKLSKFCLKEAFIQKGSKCKNSAFVVNFELKGENFDAKPEGLDETRISSKFAEMTLGEFESKVGEVASGMFKTDILPQITVEIDDLNEEFYGEFVYLLQISLYVLAKLFGVNPFCAQKEEAFNNLLLG